MATKEELLARRSTGEPAIATFARALLDPTGEPRETTVASSGWLPAGSAAPERGGIDESDLEIADPPTQVNVQGVLAHVVQLQRTVTAIIEDLRAQGIFKA